MADYDKQYKEDLERAQALSLESLALEQFKTKRLQEINKSISDVMSKSRTTSVSRASSMSETDSMQIKYDRQQNKPRPRPGAFSGSPAGSLIAPPPTSQRKSSSASSISDAPDLISFASPPDHGSSTTTSSIIDFCRQQSYNSQLVMQQQPAPQQCSVNFWPQLPTNTTPINTTVFQASSAPPPIGFNIPGSSSNGSLLLSSIMQPVATPRNPSPQLPNKPSLNLSSSLYSSTSAPVTPLIQPPALPPKNQKRDPPPVPTSSSAVKTRNKRPTSHNLIDLDVDDKNSVRVSILQEFDPIFSDNSYSFRTISPDCAADDCMSVCSFYDSYDPYDIYTGSGSNSLSDPMYAAVVKPDSAPQSPTPPIPFRDRMSTLDRRYSKNPKVKSNLLDNIMRHDHRVSSLSKDSDLNAFYKMVYKVRNGHKYNELDNNMGLIISPIVNYSFPTGASIKICMHLDIDGQDFDKPFYFTCDATSSVEHVTLQSTSHLEPPANTDKYTLKVWGYNEYLAPCTLLSDYQYIHNCMKLEDDVVLILIQDAKCDKSFARTKQDDNRDRDLTFEDVVPNDLQMHINYDNLKILLETVENEIQKLEEAAIQIDHSSNPSMSPSLQPLKVIQSLKCVINLMGCLCTLDIMDAIELLKVSCQQFVHACDTNFSENIIANCNKIRMAIQNLIETYCKAFTVDFEVIIPPSTEPIKYVQDISDSVVVRICSIYRPSLKWKHDCYSVALMIYHGMRPIGTALCTNKTEKTEYDQSQWPSRITFDHWFSFDDVPICSLARESRLVLVVFGLTKETPESDDSSNAPTYKKEEIGWASTQFFNYDGGFNQGSMLLSVWPRESNLHFYGPAPSPGSHPQIDHPIMGIEITGPENIVFPPASNVVTTNNKGDFYSLDAQTQQILKDFCAQDMLYKNPMDLREVVWEKRHYLHHIPEALPKVLKASHSWAYSCLPDLHGMLHSWRPLKAIQAMELFLPSFPDIEVRRKAVQWITKLSIDELVEYLPQLVVALRHETYENSALAEFLLDKALCSPRLAHHLFWLLSHNLPGPLPQNFSSEICEKDETNINEFRYYRRMKLMLRALLAICGESLRKCFLSQQLLVKELNDIAIEVQQTKESHRLTVLHNGLGLVNSILMENPTSLPLSPTLKVTGVQVSSCFYFPSNTLPLKLNFLMDDSSIIPAIYKVGDDLQQDMLTLQMVRLMDQLWRHEDLDLKMVSFSCVPTGKKKGMIEMISKAETLRKIQVEHGLTGSFKDKPIAEWLAKHNPSELEYERAVQNFTASCAGYCVVTYILGICDRHNDNIMLKTSGHLFHIDFGKFLGDAQMFGNFKRDRAPFVLTSDMAYVINGGDRPTEKFHKFVDLCCKGFNIIRSNRNLFLYLFTLMSSSGICGVTPSSVNYLHTALLPDYSNPEAAAYFARLIESSLKSWFTQFNFFLHNLAQLKFTNDNNDGNLLSFVPKTYNQDSDGRIIGVQVKDYQKRYDPDKYYVYILRVERENQIDPMDILRTYKEFCELHQKLCIYFPLAKLHSLSSGLHMGRSNIKQVAQKRFLDITQFIYSLFLCATEIKHSDLVYTFFHPLLRDQHYPDEYSKKAKDRTIGIRPDTSGRLNGQLKLTLQFNKQVFSVMVLHVRGLPKLANGQEPSTYVKVYLQPDDTKSTKRKTKVVKKNCHPSFMEMLEYRLPLEVIRGRCLKATVWNYDALQENEFMGGVELDLSTLNLTDETTEWYPLVNISR